MQDVAMSNKGEFQSDLEDGRVVEDYFSGWTNNRTSIIEINRSTGYERKYWDFRIKFEKRVLKFEVKGDLYCGSPEDSYNTIFVEIGRGRIEYRFNEKRNYIHEIPIITEHTGLSITRSDFWVHYLHHLNEIWIIKVEDLKRVVLRERERSRQEKRIFNKLGGKPISIGCLLPVENVRDDFHIFKPEGSEEELMNTYERLYFLFNE